MVHGSYEYAELSLKFRNFFFFMPSFFAGWSAHDIVGSLNKAEVRAALLDYDIEKKCLRSWDAIETMLLNASDEVKNTLYQCALTKGRIEEQHQMATRKRRLEEQMMSRNVRRRLGECFLFFLFYFLGNDVF